MGRCLRWSDTIGLMSHLWTEDPRLAAVYDTENAGREDHDFYLTLADELGAGRVVDIGCGTGVFAVDLARRGHKVIGVNPAGPMLDIARRRSAGLDIDWIDGLADDVATGAADLAVMMGVMLPSTSSMMATGPTCSCSCTESLRPGVAFPSR